MILRQLLREIEQSVFQELLLGRQDRRLVVEDSLHI